MKRILIAASTLLLILSPDLPASAHDPKGMGDMADMGEMSKLPQKTTMLPATNLIPGKSQLYTIQVRSASGKPINNFQIQHEKLMHLILVSSDLKSFQHVHPTYLGKGKFQITATFPADGQYTAFMDYVPKGSTQRVDVATLKVGKAIVSENLPSADPSLSKTFGDLNIALLIDPKTIRSEQTTSVSFQIKDATGKPIEDLQPYLGAMGHLVIIKASPVLTAASYLHAHPKGHEHSSGMEMGGMEMGGMNMGEKSGMGGMKMEIPGQVTFEAHFPEPGTYRLWGQFQRAGKVFTADFTITI
jgi:hypothetical protein